MLGGNFVFMFYICLYNCLVTEIISTKYTIGGAELVVSELPIRNGNNHIREICEMSLDTRHEVQDSLFIIGGDHWRCLHGSVRTTC